MTPEANDPRLTAYALGELDEREANLLAAELDGSPEGQRALAELRRTAELLHKALQAEPAPALSVAARAQIIDAATSATGHPAPAAAHDSHAAEPARPALTDPRSPTARRAGWSRRIRATLALAALATVAVIVLLPSFQASREAPRRTVAIADNAEAMGGVQSDGLRAATGGNPYWHTDDIQYQPSEVAANLKTFHDSSSRRPTGGLAVSEPLFAVNDPVDADGDGSLLVSEPLADHERHTDQAGAAAQLGKQDKNAQPWGQQTSPQDVKLEMQGKEVIEYYNKPAYPQAVESSVSQRDSRIGRYAGGSTSGVSPALAPGGQGNAGQQGQNEEYDAPDFQNMLLPMAQAGGAMPAQQTNGQNQGPGTSTFQFGVTVEGQQQNGQQAGQGEGLGGAGRLALIEREVARRPASAPASVATATDARIEELKERIARYKNPEPEHNTEAYDAITENAFQAVMQQPLSTFSIDVDTASYANVRRFLNQGSLPPRGAVRIEELINYFRYDYAGPQNKDAKDSGQSASASAASDPFAVHADVAVCPWAPEHRLVRIGLKGREIPADNRPATNLVFLLDVSGSMQDPNKLPLVKEGMRMLVERLGENDRVAIVVYAGASGLVLPSTLGSHKDKILYALDQLEAGGSTNGASGIQLAYDTAAANLIKGGANRVILCTDGDFNVGVTDQSELVSLIEREAGRGVFLSVLGFGMGNLKDSTLEKLADKGNGNYAYIDNAAEARKVLVEELSGTLVTIAKDVKIQIEFNPARVQSYRLIGYENRMLAKEDFNNDKKDAGEIGAGHTVTALYELVPAGAAGQGGAVDKLEYQTEPGPSEAAAKSSDLLTLKLRYKEPEGTESKLLKFPVEDKVQQIGAAGDDFEFAAAVAAFGMLLRGSAHKGSANFAAVIELAQAGQGADKEGYRREFIELAKKAQRLAAAYPER